MSAQHQLPAWPKPLLRTQSAVAEAAENRRNRRIRQRLPASVSSTGTQIRTPVSSAGRLPLNPGSGLNYQYNGRNQKTLDKWITKRIRDNEKQQAAAAAGAPDTSQMQLVQQQPDSESDRVINWLPDMGMDVDPETIPIGWYDEDGNFVDPETIVVVVDEPESHYFQDTESKVGTHLIRVKSGSESAVVAMNRKRYQWLCGEFGQTIPLISLNESAESVPSDADKVQSNGKEKKQKFITDFFSSRKRTPTEVMAMKADSETDAAVTADLTGDSVTSSSS